MTAKIQIRRDTAANWEENNPTPSEGEMCLETDTGKFKFGNGTDPYADLGYVEAGPESFDVELEGMTFNDPPTLVVVPELAFNFTEVDMVKADVVIHTDTMAGARMQITRQSITDGVPAYTVDFDPSSNTGAGHGIAGEVSVNEDTEEVTVCLKNRNSVAATLTITPVFIPVQARVDRDCGADGATWISCSADCNAGPADCYGSCADYKSQNC